LKTGINSRKFYEISSMVSRMMRMPVQPNKAIVGKNAFAHSSGIHQDGVLKHRENYEIINPEDVGIEKSDIILTARSGRHALKHHLARLGYAIDKIDLDRVYEKFLVLADGKPDIYDDDLIRLMGNESGDNFKMGIVMKNLQVYCGNGVPPEARISLIFNGVEHEATSIGNGPVNATINAIETIIDQKVELKEFIIQAIHGGSDDVSKVHMRLLANGKSYQGYGFSTDIVKASAYAYLDAMNKIL
jgi:2-isopropylmalate synthase